MIHNSKKARLWTTALQALLLFLLTSGQVTQCATASSPQLRFVAQLSVNGCPLFVHDTGESDGPHLVVEPAVCITDHLQNVTPKVDLVTQQLYVSVPVVLSDTAMLSEVHFELRNHLPKKVSFATVTEIGASTSDNPWFRSAELVWTFGEPVGILRLWCNDKRAAFSLASRIKVSQLEVLDGVVLSASVTFNRTSLQLKYRPVMASLSALDNIAHRARFKGLPLCRQLRFVKIVNVNGCHARVHQRLDRQGHFLIEPLLCHNAKSMSGESVMYDSTRGMHYLKLAVVLQDDATEDAVRSQLNSPLSVAFMQLWRAQSIVISALSARFEIGQLMESTDWRSAQFLVFCGTLNRCRNLRFILRSEPADFWRHLKWQVTSLMSNQCLLETDKLSSSWRSEAMGSAISCLGRGNRSCDWLLNMRLSGAFMGEKVQVMDDGRLFVIVQQRLNENVSFQRNWTEYEIGFGDETNFWIGLSAIHELSAGGITLRVELKQWDGTAVIAEYAGFQVGNASENYRMTYRNVVSDKSNVTFSFLERSHGMQFTTMDADHDTWEESCSSNNSGYAGWWFKDCFHINPNGLYPLSETYLPLEPYTDYSYQQYMIYYSGGEHSNRWKSIREVRLMLQIGRSGGFAVSSRRLENFTCAAFDFDVN